MGLEAVKRWCLRHAPEALPAFDAPAPQADVRALTEAVGPLPQPLLAFWRKCGGTEVPGPFPFAVLSPRASLACWSQLQRNAVHVFPTATDVDPGLRPAWTHRGWLPLTDDGRGNHVCVDLAPALNGRHGQVLTLLADTPARRLLAPSWSVYLEEIAAQMERGEIVAVEDRGRFFGVLRRTDLVGPLAGLTARGRDRA